MSTGSIYTTGKRVDGYRQALAAAGIAYDEALVHAAINEPALVDPAVDSLLALDDPPTAVFAANVNTAVGLLSGLRRHRWEPAIVAFSDSDAAM